jgi:hypothetical protein
MSNNIVVFSNNNDQIKEGGIRDPSFLSPVAWFDASDTSTITETGVDNKISQWNDKSGNGNHAVQLDTDKQPLTGTTTIGGLNVLTGNNVAEQANMTVTNTPTVKSCFAVFDVSAITDQGTYIMLFGSVSDSGPELFARYVSPQLSYDGSGSNEGKYSLNGGVDSEYAEGHTDTGVRDGEEIIEMVSENSFSLTNIIGRSSGSAGPDTNYKLGELIWFDTEVSTANKLLIENYLSNKWGIVI